MRQASRWIYSFSYLLSAKDRSSDRRKVLTMRRAGAPQQSQLLVLVFGYQMPAYGHRAVRVLRRTLCTSISSKVEGTSTIGLDEGTDGRQLL